MRKKTFMIFGVLLIMSSMAAVSLAATITNSPASCSGQWNKCMNAFTDNSNRASATATSSSNKTGVWSNYVFSIPNGSTIGSVIVRADFFSNKKSGFVNIRVSGDGGASFGPTHIIGNAVVEKTFLIDVTNDIGWNPSRLNNLKVEATCFRQGSGNPTCYLDWIPVQANYTPFDFSVSVNPSSGALTQGNSVATTASVTLLGGLSRLVTLSQAGCPPYSNCTFSTAFLYPTNTSMFIITTTPSTPAGTYNINITGNGEGKTRTTQYALTVNTACIRANPNVLISPLAQNGTASSILVYQTNVTNMDSVDCSPSTFNMSHIIPAGWNASFSNSTLAINPLNARTAYFYLASSANATRRQYNFTNTATNMNMPSFSGSKTAAYNVV